MKKLYQTFGLLAITALVPSISLAQTQYYQPSQYNAHDKCKSKESDKKLLGGVIGAIAGGVIGSQVSGNGARTEGSAIGAVLGGLAGAGIADKTVDCDPVYVSTPSTTYGSGGYSSTQPTYGNGQYGSTQYSTIQQYPDQITYSTHPVYNNPTYGANRGGVRHGTTYSTNTVTYPISTTTYPAPVYSTRNIRTTSYRAPTYSGRQVYNTRYQNHGHSRPVSRRHSQRHYHGKYTCNTHH